MRAVIVLLACCGCAGSVHPRVGTGLPPPSIVEVPKEPLFPEETPRARSRTDRPEPPSIGARHILIMFRGAAHAPGNIGRTREQALALAQQVLARLRAGEDFEALVREFSEEPGAAARGGALGTFSRNRMVKPFEDAAFALQPGQISDIVETKFGFHIIQRTQ